MTTPIPNSRLPINNSDSAISCKDQEHTFCPVFDIKCNENKSQKCMLPFKFNTEENSYHKKNCIQNELCYRLNEEHVNKDTEISGINLQKENNKQMNYILNVSETSGLKMNSFEDLLRTQSQPCDLTHKTSAGLTLQCAFVQKPPEGCHSGKGTEINNNEEPLVLSCEIFGTNSDSALDDKLQIVANQSEATDAALNKVVTESTSKIMEDDFSKCESELCEKCPSSRIEPFMTVRLQNKCLREHVSSQDVGHNKNVETENLEITVPEGRNHKIGNRGTEISANCLLHVADFQSSAVATLQKVQFCQELHESIQLVAPGSSKELDTETSDQLVYKEEILPPAGQQSNEAFSIKEQEYKNSFLRGRHYMPLKRKLEIPGVYQKTGKTKITLYSNQQTAYSEVPKSCSKTEACLAMNMKDVIADTFASGGGLRRKTTFQAPFKKIPSEGKQVQKAIYPSQYIIC